jgi:hypothetical protein
LKITGTAEIILDVSQLRIGHTVYVCDKLSESLLLGRSFLSDSSAVLDFRNRTITFSDFLQLPLQCKLNNENFARAKEALCIKPNTEVILPIYCNKKFNNQNVLITPIVGDQFQKFAIANSVCHVSQNQSVCRLLNCSNECLILCAGQKIAQIERFDETFRCMSISQKRTEDTSVEEEPVDDTILESFAADYKFNINSQLPADVRRDLLTVLYKRREAFARSMADLKAYNKEEFEVKLNSTRPLWQKQYKHKPEHARILQQHIDEWERAGIVETSTNYSFSNPILLVAKSSLKGAADPLNARHYRVVCDLRRLNERCKGLKTFNIPTRELIDEVTKFSDNPPFQRSKIFSSFDFCSGYLQLRLKPGPSRQYFSFTAPNGKHLAFTKIPFGWINSGHYFSLVMNRVLGPLREQSFLAYYVDDVLIHSLSHQQHIKYIDTFLSVLIENGLKCSVSKTALMQDKIRFLGVDIGPDGISIPSEVTRTLDKLENMPIKNVKAVQKLLGFFNFWRYHLPNLARRTYHLRQLIRHDSSFKFTAECQRERCDIIQALRTAGPLQPISPSEPIFIFLDSSKQGVGASVAQIDHSVPDSQYVQKEMTHIRKGQTRLKPIMHLSWTLNKSETNYGSSALEILGLVKTLHFLDHMAQAREVHIISDNVGLTSFAKLKIGNARERRMLAYLQQFNLFLHYIKGSTHVSADILSRISSELSEAERIQWEAPSNDFIDEFLFSIRSEDDALTPQPSHDIGERQWELYLITSQSAAGATSDVTEHKTPLFTNTSESETPSVTNANLSTQANEQRKASAMHNDPNRFASVGDCSAHQVSQQRGQSVSSTAPSTFRREADIIRTPPSGEPVNTTQLVSHVAEQNNHAHDNSVRGHELNHLPISHEELATHEGDARNHHQLSQAESQAVSNLNVWATPFYPSDACYDFDHTTSTATADQTDVEIVGKREAMSGKNENYNADATGQAVNIVTKKRKRAQQSVSPSQHDAVTLDPTDINENDPPSITYPRLTPEHYLQDPEYANMWNYLLKGELSGDKKADYHTVVTAPLYLIEDNKLYRLTLPRSRKRSVDGIDKIVVIPRAFQQAVLVDLHEKAGHPAGEKLFETARLLIYFKNLYHACFKVATSCRLCQQVKIDRSRAIPELHPTPIFGPGQVWAIDFKVLPRPSEGCTAILVVVDTYSAYSYFIATKDQTAVTTAQALVNHVLPHEPNIKGLISDKGSAFISGVFKAITQTILNWTHFSSSSLQPQSHGMVENYVGQLNKLINLYAADDSQIVSVLPICELAQRITVSKSRGYSPYEIMRGVKPELSLVGDVLEKTIPTKTHHDYVQWLRERLQILNKDVTRNLEKARGQQKTAFDKRNKVTEPQWKVGDRVFLERACPKAGSGTVLTHKRYGQNEYFITGIVERNASFNEQDGNFPSLKQTAIAKAYQLTDAKTGKALRYLVPSRRLKRYQDRSELDKLYPPLAPVTEEITSQTTRNDKQDTENVQTGEEKPSSNNGNLTPHWEAAKNVIRKRSNKGQIEFLVRFLDGSAYWCKSDGVSEELKKRYFLRQAQERNRKRRAAVQRFKNT